MLEFAMLHFSEALAATETEYNEVYQKRHERITEWLNALQNNNIVDTEDIKEVA